LRTIKNFEREKRILFCEPTNFTFVNERLNRKIGKILAFLREKVTASEIEEDEPAIVDIPRATPKVWSIYSP